MSEYTASIQLKCFCLDDDEYDPLDAYSLRCGCAGHYHCLIQYIQTKLGDRKGEVNEGRIACPFGVSCSSLQVESATSELVPITFQDLDDLVAYYDERPSLTPLIPCRPLTLEIVESYRNWVASNHDNVINGEEVHEEIDPYLEATSKKCPGCNFASVHYHLHGCHHLVCPRCSTNYCAKCLQTGEENERVRGNYSSCACPSGHWSTSCSVLRTKEDIIDNLDVRPVPCDIRCGCIICPDCDFQKPCDSCSGYCAVCTGDLPPSIKELGAPYDVSVKIGMDDLPSRYRRAVRGNNIDRLKSILEEAKRELSEIDFIRLLHHKSKRGISALHDASRFNCVEAVNVLLGLGLFDVLTTDNKFNNAVHVACDEGGSLSLVEAIVGANSAVLDAKNSDGDLPLHMAARSGSLELVQFLLRVSPGTVNAVNNSGDTPFHTFLRNSWHWRDNDGSFMVYLFLNSNSDCTIRNKSGWTVLEGHFIAAYLGKFINHIESDNYEGLKEILDNCPRFAHIGLNGDKNTALHTACYNGSITTIKLLCSPETVNLKNIRGESPLFIAAQNNHMEIVKYLIEQKANIFMKNIKGTTFLDLLSKEERKEINLYLKEKKK